MKKTPARIAHHIRKAITDEKDDIREYRQSAHKVDPVTARIFRHIAKDEVHHKSELTKRLKMCRTRKSNG